MVIILMVISRYFIGGYYKFNCHWLLMAISGYWWLLMVILLMVNVGSPM